MKDFMNITKALADESRVRMLMALRGGELCVCQITELFGFAPSTVSRHLSILHQAGLVESRKAERWVYYRLPGADMSKPVRRAIDWTNKCLGTEAPIVADARKLKAILKIDPAILCKSQCPK
jgi:DNA-binding transcriptional ArsR family regulator